MRRSLLLGLLLASAGLGCASVPSGQPYTKLMAANPRSILIVPPANKSVDVDAPAYLLSALPIPVAERGYYVFPVNMVKRVLEDDGLSDAFLVHQADPTRLCKLFGADAVLYVTIERWDAKYLVIAATVTVDLVYVLKDGATGTELWKAREKITYTPNSGSGGGLGAVIGSLIAAAVTSAAPDYMPLARQANDAAMAFPGNGFPAGPFSPKYRKDVSLTK